VVLRFVLSFTVMIDENMQRLRREAAQRDRRDSLIRQLPKSEAKWLQTRPFDYIEVIRDRVGKDIFANAITLPLPEKITGFESFVRWETTDQQALMEKLLREVAALIGEFWVRVDDGPFYRVTAKACYALLRSIGRFSDTLETIAADYRSGLYVSAYFNDSDGEGPLADGLKTYELFSWQCA
jgi:hypothetical protein